MYYTVKDIAELLSVNEETVRRWIRDGKLNAERGSGRQGSKISEEGLKEFLECNKGSITTSAASTLGIGTVVGSSIFAGIGMVSSGLGAIAGAVPLSIAAIAGASLGNILKSKDKNRKQMLQELADNKLELEKASLQIKFEISRQQNELRTIEEQIKIISEVLET